MTCASAPAAVRHQLDRRSWPGCILERHEPAPAWTKTTGVGPGSGAEPRYTIGELTSTIADGELDPQLLMLQEAITQRLDTLTTRSIATALLELSPGDRVEINHTARPKYLHGARGTVAGLAGQHVVVDLDRPVGRFQAGQLRCHPLCLDRLAGR
jgi:hypothetical protein